LLWFQTSAKFWMWPPKVLAKLFNYIWIAVVKPPNLEISLWLWKNIKFWQNVLKNEGMISRDHININNVVYWWVYDNIWFCQFIFNHTLSDIYVCTTYIREYFRYGKTDWTQEETLRHEDPEAGILSFTFFSTTRISGWNIS
jgi:hypothetical protein